MGHPRPLLAGLAGPVQTTSAHGSARIEAIPTDNILRKFAKG
jgi:aspartate kinase